MAGAPQYYVSVREMRFYSVKVCAEILKLHPGTVYRAVANGKTDTLGLGRGKGPRNWRGGRKAKSVNFGGLTFPSIAAAERALGYSKGGLNNILHHGKRRAREELAKRVMRYADRGMEKRDED